MVAAVRAGQSQRAVARDFGVSLLTVQRWVARAGTASLAEVDFADRSSAPQTTTRIAPELETRIVLLRQQLRADSVLGEYGAVAIRQALVEAGHPPPSLRTIQRVLVRQEIVDPPRPRRRPPPRGWYLPAVAAGQAELDLVDVVEGLRIRGGPLVEVCTACSLHGGLVQAWPSESVTARSIVTSLTTHWRAEGLPAYVQFDNDTRFTGPHQHPDVLGRVLRLCLSLGVIPVLTPPREYGFQAAIEGFNGRWQAKVWRRYDHASLAALRQQSHAYVQASHQRHAQRIADAPARRAIPAQWQLRLDATPAGQVMLLRRADDDGQISVLGRSYPMGAHWAHHLTRAEIDLNQGRLTVYGLSRRAPAEHVLLLEQPYQFPQRRFRDCLGGGGTMAVRHHDTDLDVVALTP